MERLILQYYEDNMLDHKFCKSCSQNILLIALVCALITSFYIYRHLEHSHIIPHYLTSCKLVLLCG